jgi:8-oxo-dGTP diphosphatase
MLNEVRNMKTYPPPKYKYCPMCGNTLIRIDIGKKTYQACSDRKVCKWVHWGHTPTTVAVIVQNPKDSESILLAKRSRDPFKGLWTLPAGFAEYGELPKDAARRELKEESGLSAGKISMIGQYLESSHPATFSILNVFFASSIRGKAAPADDVVDMAYYSWKVLPKMAFAGQVLAINDFFKKKIR